MKSPLLALLTLVLLLVPVLGCGESALPFQTRNLSPLLLGYGLPPAEGAAPAPPGRTDLRLLVEVASHFDTAFNEREGLVLDGETYRFTLALRRGLGRRLEVGVDLPYLVHSGGSLDGFVEDFHKAFGLSTKWRRRLPKDQLQFLYQRDGVDRLLLEDSADGLGDVRLTAAWRLSEEAAPTALALRAGLKLPTGDSDRLLGSGAADLSLGLAAARSWPAGGEIGLSGGGGVLLLGDGDILPRQQRSVVGFANLQVGWRPWQRLTLKLQFDANTPFYENSDLDELTDPSLQGSLGFSLALGERSAVDLAVSEDLIWDTAPDVTFFGAARTRF